MNAEELKNALVYFYDNYEQLGVTVYAISKNQNIPEPKKLDIEASAQAGLKKLFIESIKERISNKDDLTVLNLSNSDERADAIYVYDLEIPDELKALDTVTANDNLPLYNLDDSDITDIKALVVEIGNDEKQFVLYKNLSPVEIFGRSSFFLVKDENRLEKINEEFLRISPSFQMLKIDDVLLINDLKSLERSFGFHEIILKEAALGITAIENKILIENPDALRELLNEIKYARRFTKVAKSSPVLKANIPNESIINFCRTFPKLAGRIKFNAAGDKIILDTKVSKDLFIKLLMDDFLTSDLTKFHYESVAKDSVDEAVAEG